MAFPLLPRYLICSGRKLDHLIAFICGCVFLVFGYNQGVMSGILTMPSFLETFPLIDPDAAGDSHYERSVRSTNQGLAVASYNLGCFLGAVITIFIGNLLGRKRVLFLGTLIMLVGAALQASATALPHFIVGRVITGVGNGLNTSTVPTWQSELTRPHKRGKMVLLDGALITGGIMISYWVDFGFSFVSGCVSWRLPLALQCVFCIPVLYLLPWMPESPRWLILKTRNDAAEEVLAALYHDDEDSRARVEVEFHTIQDTVAEMSKGKFSDLFTMDKNRNLHRTLLGYWIQVFQQLSGINLITFYAAVIYSNLGMSGFMSRLLAAVNGTEYFLASIPAMFLVERVGRRKLLLFGTIGQAATMAVLAGVNSRTDKGFQIAGIIFLFVFNTFFALGWLGTSWLYPAEIVPLRIRAPANALSTSANWIFNFIVVMITPIAFNSIGYQTYVIFAAINAFIVPCVYFLYPETAGRTLEEMDSIFHKVDGWKGAFTVVEKARTEPLWSQRSREALVGQDGAVNP
ncbi:general substrate transporter [Immersiella caudata]|uniref:General substrate transporter n=1 Tax=Immersiella caudata TaxID=314043 RepID=A0AA39WPF7_9PEZI|nr:general substrate transporter [Immersiella caudata]